MKKARFIGIFWAFLAILNLSPLLCLPDLTSYWHPIPQKRIVVFVHGTLMFHLSLFNPHSKNEEAWFNTRYTNAMRRVRSAKTIQEDQPLLEPGLVEIPQNIIESCKNKTLPREDQRKGAYQIATNFEATAQTSESSEVESHYFTFGWLGLLSDSNRKMEGEKLYKELIILKKQLGQNTHITVVTHSYGGEVALNLALSEQIFKGGLIVEELIMFAPPINQIASPLIESPVFRKIYNIYSEGDLVQTADLLSSKRFHKPKRRISDLKNLNLKKLEKVDPEKKIYDVRLVYNGNPRAFDHANIWLIGKSKRVINCLDPLPVSILSPIIIKLIDNSNCSTLVDLKLEEEAQTLKISICDSETENIFCESDNLYELAKQASQTTKETWKPTIKTRNVVFNQKHIETLRLFINLKK